MKGWDNKGNGKRGNICTVGDEDCPSEKILKDKEVGGRGKKKKTRDRGVE